MTRGLFDTHLPEEMMLLARNISETKQIDPIVIAELGEAVDKAIEDNDLEVLKPSTTTIYFDAHTRKHHYDIWCFVRTKGGYRE